MKIETIIARRIQAFLDCALIDVQRLDPNWGTGFNANRELNSSHVIKLKQKFRVCISIHCCWLSFH